MAGEARVGSGEGEGKGGGDAELTGKLAKRVQAHDRMLMKMEASVNEIQSSSRKARQTAAIITEQVHPPPLRTPMHPYADPKSPNPAAAVAVLCNSLSVCVWCR